LVKERMSREMKKSSPSESASLLRLWPKSPRHWARSAASTTPSRLNYYRLEGGRFEGFVSYGLKFAHGFA
jgi:hypothetical protein